jgi:Tfp pilus assembly protein FimT
MRKNAFTLIEVLVYLGLFAILMGGMVTVAFSVFESSNRDQTKIMIQEEGDFLVAKINHALSEAKNVNVIGQELSVGRWDDSMVLVNLSGTDLNISEGGNPQVTLNNSNVEISPNVKVSPEIFTYSSDPENIQVNFTVSAKTPNGTIVYQDFFMVKYLRK